MTWFGPMSTLGECPRWDDERQELTWVDIDGGALYRARHGAGTWTWVEELVAAPLAGAVASVGADLTRGTMLAVGCDLEMRSASGELLARAAVEPGDPKLLRLNEVVTDREGRIWVGSMAYDWQVGAGSAYRIGCDLRAERGFGGLTIPNGFGWSPDGETMYSADTPTGIITAWDYDRHIGLPSAPRSLVQFDLQQPGRPDGLAIDRDGNLWSAAAGGGYVACFAPDGRELHREVVPASVPTSCCFAGPNRDRLVITTSRKRLSARALLEHPESGQVWDAGEVGAIGLSQVPFRC